MCVHCCRCFEDNFIEKVKTDITDIKGIAYCVGSIDLKPFENGK